VPSLGSLVVEPLLGIAALAERFGLGVALWPLLAAQVALLLLVPRRSVRGRE
jgi:hypothetical protein